MKVLKVKRTIPLFLIFSMAFVSCSNSAQDPKTVFKEFCEAGSRQDVEEFKSYYSNDFHRQMENVPQDQRDNLFKLYMLALPKNPRITSEDMSGGVYIIKGNGISSMGETSGETKLEEIDGEWKVTYSKWGRNVK